MRCWTENENRIAHSICTAATIKFVVVQTEVDFESR